jgi:hypothetical protein
MEQFLNSVTSLGWWISVFLVGIFINVLSAYLKPNLDKLLSTTSGWWRKKVEDKQNARTLLVHELSGNFEDQTFFAFEEIRAKFRMIVLMIFSISFLLSSIFFIQIASVFVFPIYLTLFASVITMLLAFSYERDSSKIQTILRESRLYKGDDKK